MLNRQYCGAFWCWTELPAGKHVRLLVGFTNKGYGEFVVESMEASFRYPQDYSFFLQNVSQESF